MATAMAQIRSDRWHLVMQFDLHVLQVDLQEEHSRRGSRVCSPFLQSLTLIFPSLTLACRVVPKSAKLGMLSS